MELQEKIKTIIREEKVKEDSLHAELKQLVNQLEANKADNHEGIRCLSEQVKNLKTEKQVLNNQVQILYEEKKILQQGYIELSNRTENMVSPDFLKKILEDHEKVLEQLKKEHEFEIKELKAQNEIIRETNTSLTIEINSLKEDLKTKNKSLLNSQELPLEKNGKGKIDKSKKVKHSKSTSEKHNKVKTKNKKALSNRIVAKSRLPKNNTLQDNTHVDIKNTILKGHSYTHRYQCKRLHRRARNTSGICLIKKYHSSAYELKVIRGYCLGKRSKCHLAKAFCNFRHSKMYHLGKLIDYNRHCLKIFEDK